jgi:hypothetical protein
MSLKHKLRALALGLMLVGTTLMGGNVRPEEIDLLMQTMNQTRIECVIPGESENGDGTPKYLPG